jgi:hypothetical protein
LKELRLLQKQAPTAEPVQDVASFETMMGSFLQFQKEDAEFDAMYPEEAPIAPSKAPSRFEPACLPPAGGSDYVPFAIGRRR